MKLNLLINQIKHGVSKRAPIICASLALVGVFGAVAAAIHDTPKAIQLRVDEAIKREESGLEPMTKFEAVKISIPAYIPTIATTVATSACLIASVVSGEKKYAVLAAASSLAETSFRNFKESAQEVLTPEDFKKVTERSAEKTIEHAVQKPTTQEHEICYTGHGNHLWVDTHSGVRFRASKSWVDSCINVINKRLIEESWVSLADLFTEIGVKDFGDMCEHVGWEINQDGLIERYDDARSTEEEPAWNLVFYNAPHLIPELM